ncbi:MAG: YegP family protein [Pirellulales bacterium]
MKFELYQDRRGKYRWRLRAENGKVIADSGQGYTRKRRCLAMLLKIQSYELVLADIEEVEK